ncbi:HD-GYP domain-containing protein [Catenovulum sp. SX2]|uniref:HD-GYP domain-containing protein n=1 Tax=Catenovulum sp. SX2 TaxID=3398614 RepID=UPI003F82D551
MRKIIPLSEVKIGMYVIEVTKQTGQVAVKTCGWIKKAQVLDTLAKKGVVEVAIDPDKTIHPDKDNDRPDINSTASSTERKDNIKPASVGLEMKKAKKLYSEAINLQQKIIDGIKQGHSIEIGPVKELTNQLIDSIFRNQDALACMTRIRDKDAYLYEHSLNVSILMAIFAKHLGYLDEEIEHLAQSAFLHDIGKVLVPDEILHKPGRLTEDEFEIMQKHVEYGVETLQQSQGISDECIEIVSLHHEKLNGLGYPKGLGEAQIKTEGRMLTIVDIYDAMTAERVYKKGMTPSAAFKIMLSMTPAELDAELLQQFIKCMGIHPVGTVVLLNSGKLAIVTEANRINPLQPVVKVFYHVKHKRYSEIKDVNLAKAGCTESIDKAVKPEQFGVELIKFFKQVLSN